MPIDSATPEPEVSGATKIVRHDAINTNTKLIEIKTPHPAAVL